MVNSNPIWQKHMQLLNVKIDGLELRDQLVKCLKLCYSSHSSNVKGEEFYYLDLLEWPGGEQLPPGWAKVPETGEYIRVIPPNNEGENNG